MCLEEKYLIQTSHGRFAKVRNLRADLSECDFLPIHESCRDGDHYIAHVYVEETDSQPLGDVDADYEPPSWFYIIKEESCTQVNDLESGSDGVMYTYDLHTKYQGGSVYLANRSGFYIIRSEDNTYLQTRDLTMCDEMSLTTPQKLHDDFKDGLYYFATDDFFYVVKRHRRHGLVYHRSKSLSQAGDKAKVPVSKSVIAFLQNQGMHLGGGGGGAPPPPPPPPPNTQQLINPSPLLVCYIVPR